MESTSGHEKPYTIGQLAELAWGTPRLVVEPKPITRGQIGEIRLAAADAGEAVGMQRLHAAAPLSAEDTLVLERDPDEEHPEELSYRPYPITGLLTSTASADDPLLTRLVQPNLAKTLDFSDQGIALSSQMRQRSPQLRAMSSAR